MKKRRNKFLSMLLTVVLLFSLMMATGVAAGAAEPNTPVLKAELIDVIEQMKGVY